MHLPRIIILPALAVGLIALTATSAGAVPASACPGLLTAERHVREHAPSVPPVLSDLTFCAA